MTKVEIKQRARVIFDSIAEAANDGPGGGVPPGGPKIKLGPIERKRYVDMICDLVDCAVNTAKK